MQPPTEATEPEAETRPPELSVVIPAHNESGAILSLLREIAEALGGSLDYEVLVVDDASTDGMGEVLAGAAETLPRLRVLRHRRRSGQSSGLLTGIHAARASWIATLDGDGQNDPGDLPRLWQHHLECPDLTMICGIRGKRKDGAAKRLASVIANGVRSRILKDGIEDTGCGLKLFERRLFLALPAFDHMHRFLPALARRAGAQLDTVPVGHRPRQAGRSKYGILDRFLVGLVDLVGVWWLNRRRIAPRGTSAPRPD